MGVNKGYGYLINDDAIQKGNGIIPKVTQEMWAYGLLENKTIKYKGQKNFERHLRCLQ